MHSTDGALGHGSPASELRRREGRERPGRCRLTCGRASDRCSVLLGFAGAFRRSELVALEVADVQEVEDGVRVVIRRPKSDKEAKGRRPPDGGEGWPGRCRDSCQPPTMTGWFGVVSSRLQR